MRKLFLIICTVILIVSITACSGSAVTSAAQISQSTNTVSLSTSTPAAVIKADPTAEVVAENSEVHEDAQDYVWDASAVIPIVLDGNTITTEGKGVTIEGSTATITSPGTYSLSGSLTDGQIVVDTQVKQVVRLILNGVDIHNTTGSAIYVNDAEKVVIVLAENTQNKVTDGQVYTFTDPSVDEPNAAIFSKADLSLYGSGSLVVNANYNDGITSKDGLIIASGTIVVNAVDDGIRGKDYLEIEDGNITVVAGGDGLKSDNEVDAAKGFISITNGTFDITSSGDTIQAQTDVLISNGAFKLTSGGGSQAALDQSASAKGIEGKGYVVINGGTFTINSADDAVHTNADMVINAGTYEIATGDDGMHADTTLTINGGDINITQSYEGIESKVITVNSGNIHIVSSDDGINVASGNDGSGMGGPGGQQRPGAGFGQSNTSYFLYIHGGYIVVVDADGDGIDVNGAIEMTDGVVIVNGPTQQNNGAIDYDAYFTLTGGFLVAVGSSGMAQAPGTTSTQASTLIYFNSTLPANTLIHIQNGAGEDILTYASTKQIQSLAFSSPNLVNGTTYSVFTGGSSTGAQNDGLYQDGTYQAGTQFTSFTVTGTVIKVGSGGGGAGPGGGGRQRP